MADEQGSLHLTAKNTVKTPLFAVILRNFKGLLKFYCGECSAFDTRNLTNFPDL